MANISAPTATVSSTGSAIIVDYSASSNYTGPVVFSTGTYATGFTFVGATPATHAGVIDGDTVVFALSSPVAAGATVTYGYTGGNIEDSAGSPHTAATVADGATVTNKSNYYAPTSTQFALANAVIPAGSTQLTLTFNGIVTTPLMADNTGKTAFNLLSPITGFSVTVGGVSRAINAVNVVGGNTVVLTLASAVAKTDAVLVTYAAGNLIDSTGTVEVADDLAGETFKPALTLLPFTAAIAPVQFTVSGAVATTPGGTPTITVSFANAGTAISTHFSAAMTGFRVAVNGVVRSLATQAASTNTVVLTLNGKVYHNDVITLGYTPGNVIDNTAVSPKWLAPITGVGVTGTISATPVAINTATVSTDGTEVTLTFTGDTSPILNTDNVPTGFTLLQGYTAMQILTATPAAATLVLALPPGQRISASTPVTVSYDGTGSVTDSAGTPVPLDSTNTPIAATNNSTYIGTGRELVLTTPKVLYSVDNGANYYEIGDYYPFRGNAAYCARYGALNADGVTSVDKTTSEAPGNVPETSTPYIADTHSDTVNYLWNRKKSTLNMAVKFEIVRSGSNPVLFKFTSADPDVDLYYTFNNRTPHADPAQNRDSYEINGDTYNINGVTKTIGFSRPRSGGKFDPSNPPALYENTAQQGTVIKVRAFKKYSANPADTTSLRYAGYSNTNVLSKIIRADVKITGGTSGNYTQG